MKLAGKTALIAGGRRIGGRLARLLAERGMRIALTWFSQPDAVAAAIAACQSQGVDADSFHVDLRDPAAADRLVQQVVERWGTLDVLVNLTSIYRRTPLHSLHTTECLDALQSNLLAPMWTSLAVARQMRRQPVVDGLQGKIIHFSDWAVSRPYRDYLPYLVAKGGVETLTRTLAVELAPTITVNAIAPGTVEPPPDTTAEQRERVRLSAALERCGSADDVNRAVLYLLEGTDFVTGEVYRVDGGRFLGHPDDRGASAAF